MACNDYLKTLTEGVKNMSKKKVKFGILAEGEATGHAHKVDCEVQEDGDYKKFVGASTIEHEEHGVIPIGDLVDPQETMVSGIVKEWDAFAEEAKKVRD